MCRHSAGPTFRLQATKLMFVQNTLHKEADTDLIHCTVLYGLRIKKSLSSQQGEEYQANQEFIQHKHCA